MNTPFSFNQLNDVLHDEVRAFPTNCERWSPNTLEEEKHTKRKSWKIQEAGQITTSLVDIVVEHQVAIMEDSDR
ncbi:hypothetical protein SCLCIDRAFT_765137 [Scleroderma citrinum Foug A]|uniref:Uncharacterized protein n=1 Tax=Scleroderma citrinum Foug A TaxID=1036808 RepID=A0A0C2ZCN4_9AGAM|nr:hypothetical protein SCLCIDRAFT_765137 [Scleroderma citrinum Foug A]